MPFITAERLGRPPLTPEAQAAMVARAQQGDNEARDLLVQHNMGFIVNSVMRDRRAKARMDHDELINVGVLAYLQALTTFDPSMGWKFNTYADYTIRHEVQGEVGQTVEGIPMLRSDATYRPMVYAVKDRLHGELGRKPTHEEIAAAMPETRTLKYKHRLMQVHKILDTMAVGSLDRPIATHQADNQTTLYDVTPNGHGDPLDYIIWKESKVEAVKRATPVVSELLAILGDKQREVVQRRYGLPPYQFTPDAAELGDGVKRGESRGEGGDSTLLDVQVIAAQMGISERSASAYLMTALVKMKKAFS